MLFVAAIILSFKFYCKFYCMFYFSCDRSSRRQQIVAEDFSRCLNVLSVADDVIETSRLFHTRVAATGKARSPTVERRVGGTTKNVGDRSLVAVCQKLSQEPPGWAQLMRMSSPWTLGSIRHRVRQEIRILGYKKSVQQHSISPPQKRSTVVESIYYGAYLTPVSGKIGLRSRVASVINLTMVAVTLRHDLGYLGFLASRGASTPSLAPTKIHCFVTDVRARA